MKIYTKTGDTGSAGLIGGRRAPKNALRFQALGSVDELNASLGQVSTSNAEFDSRVREIQCLLFSLGAELASEGNTSTSKDWADEGDIQSMETDIDIWTAELPPLTRFILPGGSPSSAQIHTARAISRRAERDIVSLAESGAEIRPTVLAFINRLSDWLFTAARYAASIDGTPDIEWKGKQK